MARRDQQGTRHGGVDSPLTSRKPGNFLRLRSRQVGLLREVCARLLAALEPISLEMLGGTRRQFAAAFVTAQPDCIALVVSQDGVVSLFSWLEEERAVLVARELEITVAERTPPIRSVSRERN